MKTPIIDLHCDLLAYLEEDPGRTPLDSAVHCSIPQLKEGNVQQQVLAVFTKTSPDSVVKGMKQIEIFRKLPSDPISFLYAIENASGFCDEAEPLQAGIKRLNEMIRDTGKPAYIGLTWNMENRFGGGNLSPVGLKEDGKILLEELDGQGIALDFSHTSDALAYDLLNHMESKNLSIPVLASHSNARKVVDVPRNLPDEIAKEIFHRGGVVGLNFYKKFVGESAEWFCDHIAHWLELGGEKGICFGADFFYEGDFPNVSDPYISGYGDARCYGRVLELLKRELGMSDEVCAGLANENAKRFLGNK